MNDVSYERACVDVLVRLDDWHTAEEADAPIGQLRSLSASGLIRSSPDFFNYNTRTAHHYPHVWRRTKAGDRAVKLLAATGVAA